MNINTNQTPTAYWKKRVSSANSTEGTFPTFIHLAETAFPQLPDERNLFLINQVDPERVERKAVRGLSVVIGVTGEVVRQERLTLRQGHRRLLRGDFL